MNFSRLSFLASDAPAARRALKALSKRYGNARPEAAEVIVALGGDGLMLEALHACIKSGLPVYGMNRGSVGFLMNNFRLGELPERINAAEQTVIRPLRMTAKTPDGKKALIVLNNTSTDQTFNIKFNGKITTSTLNAGSVATYVW